MRYHSTEIRNQIESFLIQLYLQSQTPIVSLILCILNCGQPTSTALIPVVEEIKGPIVDPHPQSCLTINSCKGGRLERRAISRIMIPVGPDVAYFWFAFRLITIPAFI